MTTKGTNWFTEALKRARDFIEERRAESTTLRPALRRLRTVAQVVYFVARGFQTNRCSLRAAALCYTTLLALVPLLAVALSVSKGFLKESSATIVPQVLDKAIAYVAPQLEILPLDGTATNGAGAAGGRVQVSEAARSQVVSQIQTFIGNIDAGALGTIGTVALILVVIQLLTTIELTFNDIWGVTQGRSLWRKIVYYWAAVTLGPVIVFTAIALTGRAEFQRALGTVAVIPGAERLVLVLTPYLILWAGFACLYALMPNTQVRWQAALVGGLVAGSLWQINSLLNTMYFSRVVTYSKIYGGLGTIPVFLLGLYLSWVIVLLGAQVSYAFQNSRAILSERATERVDQACRERLACHLVLLACRHFVQGRPPLSITDLAVRLGTPPQLLNQITQRLVEGGVLIELAAAETTPAPARPPEHITLADVLHVMRTHSGICGQAPVAASQEIVDELLTGIDLAARQAKANTTFRELAAA